MIIAWSKGEGLLLLLLLLEAARVAESRLIAFGEVQLCSIYPNRKGYFSGCSMFTDDRVQHINGVEKISTLSAQANDAI